MATAHEVALYDGVEPLEALGAAPAGARAGVVERPDHDIVMVEVMEPNLTEGLDRIVVAPISKLKRIEPPSRP